MLYKIVLAMLLSAFSVVDKAVPTSSPSVISRVEQKKAIGSVVNDAAKLFALSPRDIWAIIYIESSAQPEIMGSSGEFGLMQIMPGEFTKYGPKVNKTLDKKGRLPISWESDRDRLNPRTNIYIGGYILAQRKRMYNGDIVLAAMSHNVGRGGTRMTIRRMETGDPLWYCFRIKRGIRVGRQVNYAKKFAKRARRMKEWENLFGDIPDEYIEAFRNGTGEEICEID